MLGIFGDCLAMDLSCNDREQKDADGEHDIARFESHREQTTVNDVRWSWNDQACSESATGSTRLSVSL